jgi:hypothetical protein
MDRQQSSQHAMPSGASEAGLLAPGGRFLSLDFNRASCPQERTTVMRSYWSAIVAKRRRT